MSNSMETARSFTQAEVVDGPSSLADAQSRPTSTRRAAGENRIARNARLIAVIAERLSRVMDFGDLAEQDLYTIGQLSDHLRVSLRTLRFYEQAGLLRPIRDGVRRLYTKRDIDQLQVIVSLREMEASLGAIAALMTKLKDLDDEKAMVAAVEGLLMAITSANADRIDELKRLNRRIDASIAVLDAAS